jgi:hypothetical protein
MASSVQPLPLQAITQRILVIREQKVLLDSDLAILYGVETRRLNEQVRRNRARFPAISSSRSAPKSSRT